jgi:hypothetical protein
LVMPLPRWRAESLLLGACFAAYAGHESLLLREMKAALRRSPSPRTKARARRNGEDFERRERTISSPQP